MPEKFYYILCCIVWIWQQCVIKLLKYFELWINVLCFMDGGKFSDNYEYQEIKFLGPLNCPSCHHLPRVNILTDCESGICLPPSAPAYFVSVASVWTLGAQTWVGWYCIGGYQLPKLIMVSDIVPLSAENYIMNSASIHLHTFQFIVA